MATTKMPPRGNRRRVTISFTLVGFVALILVETKLRIRFGITDDLQYESSQRKVSLRSYHQDELSVRSSRDEGKPYRIKDSIKNEYKRWHSTVRKLSQMHHLPSEWTPNVNWEHHERFRSRRFPSVEERIKYYMGKWHNTSIPMYGLQFNRDTYIQRQSTIQYGAFADILVNLYDLDRDQLMECYQNKKELQVFAPYCRDYIDIAILHSGGLANIIHFIGDALPSFIPHELAKYPMFTKVRTLCGTNDNGYLNRHCKTTEIVQPTILPLNRKRHFGIVSEVPNNDIPWDKKKPVAVWRGKYEKAHVAGIENGSIESSTDMKYALVSTHLNSTFVDAKFSKHNDDAPIDMIGSYMDMKDQLKYRYIISIEGNDVSSGLKWMLFSNSLVLAPTFTWESWAMEARLEPFVHYIPIRHDMSNVEEMIDWAENHPEQARLIAERSTLFVYDLLFHPDAIEDERLIMEGIMEAYENNFGHGIIEKGGTDQNYYLLSDDQSNRSERFPYVDERVEYYMGKWNDGQKTISMNRNNIDQLKELFPAHGVTADNSFIAFGSDLSRCAHHNSSDAVTIQLYCKSALPHFNEGNTADLKSNSFKRLLKTSVGSKMTFADRSSWRNDLKAFKESKRVLLDSSVKVINFGSTNTTRINVPVFSRWRIMERQFDSIIWPFGVRDTLLTPDVIRSLDTAFASKHAKAVKVGRPDHTSYYRQIQSMLAHRYLAVSRDEICHGHDLMWMLYSHSVVFMPRPYCESWLMESKLQPFIHYIPINNDMTNINEMVRWAEENTERTLFIAKHSTLFIHDLFFHPDAMHDEMSIIEKMMERYRLLYG